MIAQSYNLMLQGCCNQDYEFSVGQNIDMTPLNFISVSQILFPKNIYQITSDFTLTIDATVIQFKIGNITFAGLIQKIKAALPTYTVREYLSNEYQQTAKLEIKNGTNNVTFSLSNNDYINFFGNLQYDNTAQALISQNICNLSNNILVVLKSNLVASLVPQFNSSDVLYSFSLDNSVNYGYTQIDNIDVIQNKQPLVRNRQFYIKFEDQNGNKITFQNNSAFFVRITLFHYKVNWINYLQNNLAKLLNVYVYKNFKKEIQEDENKESVDNMDINQNVQQMFASLEQNTSLQGRSK